MSEVLWHSQHTRQQLLPSPPWVWKTSCFCTAVVGTNTGALTNWEGLWDSHCLCYFPGLSTNTVITLRECYSSLMFLGTSDIESPPSGTAPLQMQAKRCHPKSWLRHLQVFWPCPNSAPAVSLDLHSPAPSSLGHPSPRLCPCPHLYSCSWSFSFSWESDSEEQQSG